ncbi:hypothetical protein SM763_21065, partial [Pseudophaeobacter sp. C1-32P7]
EGDPGSHRRRSPGQKDRRAATLELHPVKLNRRGVATALTNVLCPIDNQGVEGAGCWYLGLRGDMFWLRAIARFYNPVRRHSSLGFLSPIAFEQKARKVS